MRRFYLRHQLLKIELPDIRDEPVDFAFEQQIDRQVSQHNPTTEQTPLAQQVRQNIRRLRDIRPVNTRSGRFRGRRGLRRERTIAFTGLEDAMADGSHSGTEAVRQRQANNASSIFRKRKQDDLNERVRQELDSLYLASNSAPTINRTRLRIAKQYKHHSSEELRSLLRARNLTGIGPKPMLLSRMVSFDFFDRLNVPEIRRYLRAHHVFSGGVKNLLVRRCACLDDIRLFNGTQKQLIIRTLGLQGASQNNVLVQYLLGLATVPIPNTDPPVIKPPRRGDRVFSHKTRVFGRILAVNNGLFSVHNSTLTINDFDCLKNWSQADFPPFR